MLLKWTCLVELPAALALQASRWGWLPAANVVGSSRHKPSHCKSWKEFIVRELGLREWPKTCVVRGCENAAVVGAHVWTRARDDGDVEPARAYWWEAVTARPGEAYDLAGTSYDDRTADDPPERIALVPMCDRCNRRLDFRYARDRSAGPGRDQGLYPFEIPRYPRFASFEVTPDLRELYYDRWLACGAWRDGRCVGPSAVHFRRKVTAHAGEAYAKEL